MAKRLEVSEIRDVRYADRNVPRGTFERRRPGNEEVNREHLLAMRCIAKSADPREVLTAPQADGSSERFVAASPNERGLPSTITPASSSRQACYETNGVLREVVQSHGI